MTSRDQGFRRDGKCYIICEGQEVEVNEPVYQTIMRDVWREEKRKQRSWRCRDGKGFRCNKDCEQCELYRLGEGPTGNNVSLDQLYDEFDYEPQGSEGFEEIVALENDINNVIEKYQDEVPNLKRIISMIKNGELIKEVAAELCVPPTTLKSRKDNALKLLRKYLSNYR